MAIYRPPKARWPLVVASTMVGLLVGLIAGWVLGAAQNDPDALADEVRTTLRAAAASLDVARIEYAEALDSSSASEHGGALDALASSRERYNSVAAALEVLAPERAAAIADHYQGLSSAMEAEAPVDDVESQIESLTQLLSG